MDDNIEKAVISLGVTAIGSLAYIAYKHPRGYAKLRTVIVAIWAVLWAAANIWNAVIVAVGFAFLKVDLGDKFNLVTGVLNGLMLPFFWMSGLSLAFGAYLYFLSTLPRWLLEHEEPEVARDLPKVEDGAPKPGEDKK